MKRNRFALEAQATVSAIAFFLMQDSAHLERSMTSISSVGFQHQWPLATLQNELTSEVSSGTMSSSDRSALSSALTDIDSALQSDASSSPPRRPT